MPPARNHPRRHGEEEIQSPVDVDQADQFVAAAQLVAPGIGLLRLDRMVVLVEPQPVRTLVVFLVGDEQLGAVADEQAFLVQEPQRAQRARHFPVEPGVQPLRLGVAGELAQEVLVARSLAVVVVLAVETGARQGHIVGFRMGGFAATPFWPQGVDETAPSHHPRKGVLAFGAMQLEGEFAGQVKPHRDFLLFPRGGVVLGQTVPHIAANEVAEEVGLGGLRDMLQIIDLAAR